MEASEALAKQKLAERTNELQNVKRDSLLALKEQEAKGTAQLEEAQRSFAESEAKFRARLRTAFTPLLGDLSPSSLSSSFASWLFV